MRRSIILNILFLIAFIGFRPVSVNAQVYVINTATGYIGEYTLTGAKVNSSLIFDGNGPLVTAVSGSNLYVVNSGETNPQGSIANYNTSGATVNAALVTSINEPNGFALSGADLFLVNYTSAPTGRISEYTTAGATVNASLVSGFSQGGVSSPTYIAVSGSNIFLANTNGGAGVTTVSEYTTAGSLVSSDLITVPSATEEISGMAVSGSDLFVMGYNSSTGTNGTIGEYTTAGATVNASLVTGLTYPLGLAVSGLDIYVTNYNANTIGEYTTSGATVNASLITGLSNPQGIAVVAAPVPEPAFPACVMLSLCALALNRPFSKRQAQCETVRRLRK